jgi:hypothetical protein
MPATVSTAAQAHPDTVLGWNLDRASPGLAPVVRAMKRTTAQWAALAPCPLRRLLVFFVTGTKDADFSKGFA